MTDFTREELLDLWFAVNSRLYNLNKLLERELDMPKDHKVHVVALRDRQDTLKVKILERMNA